MADELRYEVDDGVATVTLNQPDQRNALNGELLAALVDAMRSARDDEDVRAVVLTGAGEKVFCCRRRLGGFAATDVLVVSARTAGVAADRAGISLFLVDPKSRGVSVRAYGTQDARRAAEVRLEGVTVADDARVGAVGEALPAIERAMDRANAALCAEAVGIIDALNEATLEYLKTRKQFGQPIGRFQVLQHRMVDMTIKAVEARSMAILAAAAMSSPGAAQRSRRVSSAKAFVGQAARFVGEQAIQLHGAIGMTDELVVSHWFKRLAMIDATFGNAEHHLGRVSDMILAEET